METQFKTDDLNATHYTRHSSLQNELANDILNNFPINPEAVILDVGCGDGRITAELACLAIKGSVIGLDASPSMIEFASKNFPKSKFSNLNFYLSTIEEAAFLNKFTLITSFSCFHWLKDAKKILQKLNSYLKDNGELIILTYPKESPYYEYLEIALNNFPEYKPCSSNLTMLTVEEYRQYFRENYFEILNFDQKKLFATYNNTEELYHFIRGWINNYVFLPEELQNSFIQNIIEAVLKNPNTQQDSNIVIPYTALIMRVKKKTT